MATCSRSSMNPTGPRSPKGTCRNTDWRTATTVIHAPLADVKLDAEVWKWYDLEDVELPEKVSILLIDGPPQSTGPLARYPALPILLDRLTDDAVIFLDDGIRSDEAAVMDRWLHEIPGLTVIRHKDKKETFEIHRVSR